MLNEPVWLSVDQIIGLNLNAVSDTGEPHSIIGRELLESAVAAPQQTFSYDQNADMVTLACTLMISIARAHAFLQGDKRTGFVAGIIFLSINGHSIRRDAAFDERAATLIIAALADESKCDALLAWVRKFARRRRSRRTLRRVGYAARPRAIGPRRRER